MNKTYTSPSPTFPATTLFIKNLTPLIKTTTSFNKYTINKNLTSTIWLIQMFNIILPPKSNNNE
ncbi:hypothetical protein CGC59_02690 [Capnocytophaga sputigena]|uniref:Uncharacterized protein n=1 Tax=Capnocytophaga sputigena TaxID=1019 RepID=A0A250F3K5_CAPSP|nr:hypothetical protein CGC59_02690 [Capnocytophaga sputigena]